MDTKSSLTSPAKRFIVEVRDGIDEAEAFEFVLAVVRAGRVSNDWKQHCYAVQFGDPPHTLVVTDLNLRSERFVVQRVGKEKS